MSKVFIAAAEWSCCYYFGKVKDHLIPVAFCKAGGNRDGQNNHLVGFKTVMDFPLQTL